MGLRVQHELCIFIRVLKNVLKPLKATYPKLRVHCGDPQSLTNTLIRVLSFVIFVLIDPEIAYGLSCKSRANVL